MRSIFTRRLGVIALSSALSLLSYAPAFAQTAPGTPTVAYSQQQLENIVGRIALYPDDLIAITLPASTYPLDVVKAQRFLERFKSDPTTKPDASMADPVVKLLNYPDVIRQMNDDLDWTQSLGDAVDADEPAVLAAIQSFRAKAQSAGNLNSNEKQIVRVEDRVITIAPANPEVIYVPVYQPARVIVYSPVPYMWGYYPTPYPSYYYPYTASSGFFFGFVWGAAIGSAWSTNWYGGHIYNNVTVNINHNYYPGRPGGPMPYYRPTGGQNWRYNRPPTQTHYGFQTRQSNFGSRPGDYRPNDRFQGGQRPNNFGSFQTRPTNQSNATTPNYQPSNRGDRNPTMPATNNGASRPEARSEARPQTRPVSTPSNSSNETRRWAPEGFARGSAFNEVNTPGQEANRASIRGFNSRPIPSPQSAQPQAPREQPRQNFSHENNSGPARPSNNARHGNERR
ncbi:DUF3300 domain-containing protein [Sapientia aquatica]|uniref:DUF3300 domain-containing protein n=1 Tax=Sapientia aquatica TaxID=1549640 RepID=A0A4R5VS03_9BURK|nr:DUF3300 domain-containing protein [Sapientia aquatica]TDK61347.1 DUF3300 domain-containing protein [Sapientia aquatica]